MKSVLLIAFHFPPASTSSGLQRALSNVAHLGESGWNPVVLTAHSRAHSLTDSGQLKDIPENVPVAHAFALDARRHLSIKGQYFSWLALPDPWSTWWLGGVFTGLKLIRRHKPSIIWSTYPIATSHLIGLTLKRLTGLPWVADFRDPMTQANYPPKRSKFLVYQWIERKAIENCCYAVFTTPGTAAIYRERYPNQPESKWQVIPNGYNDSIFEEVESIIDPAREPKHDQRLTLLHSGIIYPLERNPKAFFEAIAELLEAGQITSKRVRIILRASGHDSRYSQKINELGIESIVELAPSIPYRDAIAEAFASDGLIILQGNTCNEQIPAKLYEYFRTQRPILTLADRGSDTATTARNAGLEAIAPLEDKDKIKTTLLQFISDLENGTAISVSRDKQALYGRKEGVRNLAAIFDLVSEKDRPE